jgi:hypothetical protein
VRAENQQSWPQWTEEEEEEEEEEVGTIIFFGL